MKKPMSREELLKLFRDLLQKYEQAFCANVAMSLVLKKNGLLTDQIPQDVRTTVHATFAPVFAAIEAQDEEALREVLLNMPTSNRIM
jgi:hypothetical protein